MLLTQTSICMFALGSANVRGGSSTPILLTTLQERGCREERVWVWRPLSATLLFSGTGVVPPVGTTSEQGQAVSSVEREHSDWGHKVATSDIWSPRRRLTLAWGWDCNAALALVLFLALPRSC